MQKLPARSLFSGALVLCLTTVSLVLTGCATSFSTNTPVATPGAAITGRVHGGNQMVGGSKIYLYAAGTGGYGTPARSMLGGAGYVTSGTTDGSFTITGDYTCQPGDEVYLLALQGDPGPPVAANNPALALMAALGKCSDLNSSTFIIVNEVTTAAAAYALAGFMSSPTQLSSSGTALAQTGVANAFLNAANLANFSTGSANAVTVGGNGIVPQYEINSLADILAACVNSDGTGTACSSLFAATTPPGGPVPTNTVQAMLNIAHNPGQNVSALFSISQATAPFQNTLSTAPNDWSVSISFTGGGLSSIGDYSSTYAIAIDATGNVWVANLDSISEFDPTGTPISPSTGYLTGLDAAGFTLTNGMALDSANNAWVGTANSHFTSSRVVKFQSGGTILSPAGGYTGGGLASIGAGQMAFDPTGSLWIANANNGSTVAKLSSTGSAQSPAGGFSAGLTYGYSASLASDTSGNIWAGGVEFANNGTVLSTTSPCGTTEFGTMAIDHAGDLWAAEASYLFKCDASGNLVSTGDGYPTNLDNTQAVALDGLNRPWFQTYEGQIGVMTNAGVAISPSGGYQNDVLNYNGINYFAIDSSGNVWCAADGPYLVEFVGIAAPVVTPLVTATATNQLGTLP